MFSEYSTPIEYQPDYLQERMQAYDDAHADGEQIIRWLGNILHWVGNQGALWRARLARKGANYEYHRSPLV